MAYVEWTEELSIGIPQVDGEHQKLVTILNLLNEAVVMGKGTQIMGELLSQLVENTIIHFESEEQLMSDAEYPDLEEHQYQHQKLVEEVGTFKQEFDDSRQRVTHEMMEFLKFWLSRHIVVDDMAFGKYYKNCPMGLDENRD